MIKAEEPRLLGFMGQVEELGALVQLVFSLHNKRHALGWALCHLLELAGPRRGSVPSQEDLPKPRNTWKIEKYKQYRSQLELGRAEGRRLKEN